MKVARQFYPIYLTMTVILGTACNFTGEKQHISFLSSAIDTGKYFLSIDSAKIENDSLCLQEYLTSAAFLSSEGQMMFYGYNRQRSCIDVFSVNKRKFDYRIPLRTNNILTFDKIEALFVASEDSIFLVDAYYIGLIDSRGKIIHRWKINERASDNSDFFKRYSLNTSLPPIFIYQRHNHNIYLQQKENSQKYGPKTEVEFEKSRLMAVYNLDSKSAKSLDMRFDPQFIKQYYGAMIQPSVSFINVQNTFPKVLYIFPPFSNLYIQDFNSDSLYVYKNTLSTKADTFYNLNWDDAVDEDLVNKHFSRNINYFKILESSDSTFFYRFEYGPMNKNDSNYSKVFLKKQLYVTVFSNPKLSICYDSILNFRNAIPISAVSYGDSIFIPLANIEKVHHNYISFLKIKLEKR